LLSCLRHRLLSPSRGFRREAFYLPLSLSLSLLYQPPGNRNPLVTNQQDYAQRTVTVEAHPHLGTPHASVHPCKHAHTMKRIVDALRCEDVCCLIQRRPKVASAPCKRGRSASPRARSLLIRPALRVPLSFRKVGPLSPCPGTSAYFHLRHPVIPLFVVPCLQPCTPPVREKKNTHTHTHALRPAAETRRQRRTWRRPAAAAAAAGRSALPCACTAEAPCSTTDM